MRLPPEGLVLAVFLFLVGLFDLYAHDPIGFFFILCGALTLAHELRRQYRASKSTALER